MTDRRNLAASPGCGLSAEGVCRKVDVASAEILETQPALKVRRGDPFGRADPLDDLTGGLLDDDSQPVIGFIVVFDVIPGSHAVHGFSTQPWAKLEGGSAG